ncbi:unnamed protein product [Dovyalis caffra]|uniref:Uncharacterized protein n=1 Tax=Dovyalis caffra TaxID=77055 RepID=A0AAV1RP01_9ROSI|nr:unnamed protein product [Dovyalis caffra]
MPVVESNYLERRPLLGQLLGFIVVEERKWRLGRGREDEEGDRATRQDSRVKTRERQFVMGLLG